MNIFFTIFTQPLANGLVVFYKVFGHNLGLAIIFFSLFLRLLLNPLTKPYMDSMKKMKDLNPQLQKIKDKYNGDKVKLAQAQADFYKEKGINPGSGCLPYILQIVILIALFNVFTRTLSPGVDIKLKFNELLYPALRFQTEDVINTRFFYLDLTKPDSFSLPGISFKLPGIILLLSTIAQVVSSKMMAPVIALEKKEAKSTPGSADDFQVSMQQSMVYTFPLLTLVIGLRFPSGLAIYWFIFSASQVFQQYRSQGWGGLTPWLIKLKLLKSQA